MNRPGFGRRGFPARLVGGTHAWCVAVILALAMGSWGCGGRIASNGCAMVTGVGCDGSMGLLYKDGKTAMKRLESDNLAKTLKVVDKNRFQPARFVETGKGSTLTFPDGDTVTYKDVKKNCPSE